MRQGLLPLSHCFLRYEDPQARCSTKPSGKTVFRDSGGVEGKREMASGRGREDGVVDEQWPLPKMEGNTLWIKQGQTRQLSENSHPRQPQSVSWIPYLISNVFSQLDLH